MKLDRNINADGKCKYALIKLRMVKDRSFPVIGEAAPTALVPVAAIDFANTGDSECFVIRLKDKYANAALMAYANHAHLDDPEYAEEVFELAKKARNHPNKKRPD